MRVIVGMRYRKRTCPKIDTSAYVQDTGSHQVHGASFELCTQDSEHAGFLAP